MSKKEKKEEEQKADLKLIEEFLSPRGEFTKLPGEHKASHEARLPGHPQFDIKGFVSNFNETVVGAYNKGVGDTVLPADIGVARSIIPSGTAALRDFSYIAPEIPQFHKEKCVGCMKCVTECPDTAILAKVVPESKLQKKLDEIREPEERKSIEDHFSRTKKYYDLMKKRNIEPGMFGIFIDPTKCKGCAECVEVCHEMGYDALSMITKRGNTIENYKKSFHFFKKLPETPKEYIVEKSMADIMLTNRALLYVGGAGSCAGCGEATTLRMMLAATGFQYGPQNIALVAATGCNTVYGSTYPYNPFLVPWINSLFENAPTVAMGIRDQWDKVGWKEKRLWVIGGDGALYDIGFQSLSRLLTSGKDVKVLILDTQVYSNTGGQASTSTFSAQEAKMAAFGKVTRGKVEYRKEISRILMMHPHTYVAQTTTYFINHFYKAVMEANEFPGPAVINAYTSCMPEHGVADNLSFYRGKMAVYSRAFPLLIYDPRKGTRIRERLSLHGNPAEKEDWYINPRTGEVIDFLTFARGEARFAKHFDKDGHPSPELLKAQADRLQNWRLLQEMAGLR